MIDRNSRDRLAELLRHLVCGQMTNDDFSDTAGKVRWGSKDRAVQAIYDYADGLYSDEWTYRLRGSRRVSDEVRRQIAIAAMFLYSDFEYEWPKFSGPVHLGYLLRLVCAALPFSAGLFFLMGACILASQGLFVAFIGSALVSASCFVCVYWLYLESQTAARRAYLAWRERQNRFGDFDVWPFLRQADFDSQRQSPRLLTGEARSTASN